MNEMLGECFEGIELAGADSADEEDEAKTVELKK